MIATSEWENRKAARNECYRRGLDLRRGEDGYGSHPRTARFNPQGDDGAAVRIVIMRISGAFEIDSERSSCNG